MSAARWDRVTARGKKGDDMGCCGDASEEETELLVLFRDLPDDVLAIRRVAFPALRRHERLDPDELSQRTGRDEQAVRAALRWLDDAGLVAVSYTHLRAHETRHDL